MSTKGNGSMTRHMGKESTFMQRARHTKEAGLRTSNKAEAKRNGQMALSTMATISAEKSMAEVYSSGQTEQSTKASGKIIRCMARVSSNGLTAEFTKEST
jgi:hypothetical protein